MEEVKKNITGSNLYSYKITPEGFTASQPGGANLLVQNIAMDGVSPDDWKIESVRTDVAKNYVYNKNLLLLKEAQLAAKTRVRGLYELSLNEPIDIDGVLWDARKESIQELISVQIVYMSNGLPIVLNDAFNKPHTFDTPVQKPGVPITLVPVISKISLSIQPKIEMKNKLYADILLMTNIDEINKFNPSDNFGLTNKSTTNTYY